MADTAKYSIIALPIISLFELVMIVRWLLLGKTLAETTSVLYLCEYLVLLTASLTVFALILHFRRDIIRHYRKINLLQSIYAAVIVVWSLGITWIGSRCYDLFDYLVYVTIVIIVPVFCFMSPLKWVPIQTASSLAMLYIARSHPGFQAFCVNFSVFTIISIVASWNLYRVRYAAYKRQIDLLEERDQTRYRALHDPLTDCQNRSSYIEDLDRISKAPCSETLILAMFDVNGLKKVNDTLGHSAGDELLRGAAACLEKSFSGLGTIYRVGGDEFTGIFHGSGSELEEAIRQYTAIEATWHGNLVTKLSVSIGTASTADFPAASLKELETIADDAMYAAKQAYYARLSKF